MCSSVPEAFVQISAPGRTLLWPACVLQQCNSASPIKWTILPPPCTPVTYWTSLPNCALFTLSLNTFVTKHVPMLLWFDCGLWQCISQMELCLCNWSTMYNLQLKKVAVHLWAQQCCIVFVPLAYLSKCPVSPRSEFAGKQRMRGAQVTGFWAPSSPSRWKWDTLQSESLGEFLWAAISGTGDKMKLRHPTSLCRPHDKNSKKSATIVLPLSSLGNASFWNIFPKLIKDE